MENPKKTDFSKTQNFSFFAIARKVWQISKIHGGLRKRLDRPVEKPLWAQERHFKRPSYATLKMARFSVFWPKIRIFCTFWPTAHPFVGGFGRSKFLVKAHGRPVQTPPKPGRSGNRFTRIFIWENWSKMAILPILTQLWPALAGKPVDQFQPLRWPRTGLKGLFKDQLWANDRKHKRANCGRPKNLRQLIASRPC